MKNIEALEQRVRELYDAKDPNRSVWADWLAAHHVFVVADNATELARRFGADEDLARAAALLHDIADIRLSRQDDAHEAESLAIARELLTETGFSAEDIALVVDDAIVLHSCYEDKAYPVSLEGQILATADALAHIRTDFYLYTTMMLGKDMDLEGIKAWSLKKLDRDFNRKIRFDEVKAETQADYDMLRTLFSR